MKKFKTICCEDLYVRKKTDSPEVNRLRNILAALVNLCTQLEGSKKDYHRCLLLSAQQHVINFETEILRLRSKKGGRK